MNIIVTKNYADMSRKAANIIAAQVILKRDSVLGLATGSTPIGLYQELIAGCNRGDLDFSACTTANLDEYEGLPASNHQSYAWFMRHNLFDGINIDPSQVNIPSGVATDGQAECARYDALVAALGVDIQLLGIGHDGHIGFNEPCDVFPKGTHRVALTETTIQANARFFTDGEQVPTHAYTMGIGTIMSAKHILLIASGKDKAEIMKKALTGEVTPQVPASILQLHPNVTVIGDVDALALL